MKDIENEIQQLKDELYILLNRVDKLRNTLTEQISLTEKIWIPLDKFMKCTNTTKAMLNNRIASKQWYDGFVIKKQNLKWGLGCLSDYDIWKNLIYRKKNNYIKEN